MDYRIAEFVRLIDPGERVEDLVDEAKADTWTKAREHAVLLVQEDGQRSSWCVADWTGSCWNSAPTADQWLGSKGESCSSVASHGTFIPSQPGRPITTDACWTHLGRKVPCFTRFEARSVELDSSQ